MNPIMVGIYFLLCLLLGIVGRGTRVGGIGVFLLAVIVTPLVVGIVLAVLRPLPRAKAVAPGSH
jgi:hypothetical protein